jgi:hypothetical protein
MSTERINQITCELIGIAAELQSITARALPLVQELGDLGIPLPPEARAMFLAMRPRKDNSA